MDWMPLSYLKLDIYSATELNSQARKNMYQDELLRFDRYKDTPSDGWQGLWEITSGEKRFRLCTRVVMHTGFHDHLLVALFKLKKSYHHLLFPGGTDALHIDAAGFPLDLFEIINKNGGMSAEVKDSLMVMEWGQGNGMMGEKKQATDFCRACFFMMAKWPLLFE